MDKTPETNLDWALMYQSNGLSIVPTIPNSKLCPFTHASRDALTADEIKRIWGTERIQVGTTSKGKPVFNNPNYGIALKTKDIFCIDIDTPKHGGTHKYDGIKAIEENKTLASLLHDNPTLVAQSPSGGFHYYYFKNKGKPNKSQSGILKGVDIQASPNNLSLMPPTTNQQGAYKWLNAKDVKIMTAPSELVDYLNKLTGAGKEKTKNILDISILTPNYRSKGWTGRLLDGLFVELDKDTTRNAYLTNLIGRLLITGAEPETCYRLLYFANSNFNDPLEDKEVDKIFLSIYRKDESNGNTTN